MTGKPPQEDDDWKAAEEALAEARQLHGSQRFEALKKAGQLRYDAHKKRHEKEPNSKLELPSGSDHGAEIETASGTGDGE